MVVFYLPYLRGSSIKCTYIPVQFYWQQNIFPCNKMVLNTYNGNIWTLCYCIHGIASGGYYGFHFVTPPPPQWVERFHCYRSNKQNIIASLLKFAGYIHNHKILPGNIFGLILKNKMAGKARHGRFFDFHQGLMVAV